MVTMSTDAWREHEPITALRGPEGEREWLVVGCKGCGWRSTPDSYGSAGFAHHLLDLNAPEYLYGYWSFWADLVEVPFGELDREQISRELADYSDLMRNVSRVYDHLAGLSKPNTAPEYIIRGAEERAAEEYSDQLCDRAWLLIQDGELRAGLEMRALAEEWRVGSWKQFVQQERWRQSIAGDYEEARHG